MSISHHRMLGKEGCLDVQLIECEEVDKDEDADNHLREILPKTSEKNDIKTP
jgi:hypothetical protein